MSPRIRESRSQNGCLCRALSLAKRPGIKQNEYPEAESCVSVSPTPSKEAVFSITSARSRLPPPGIPKIANRSNTIGGNLFARTHSHGGRYRRRRHHRGRLPKRRRRADRRDRREAQTHRCHWHRGETCLRGLIFSRGGREGASVPSRLISLRRRGITHRLAKGVDLITKCIDLVAILLARERIDDGKRRRDDKASRMANRGGRASGCPRDTFAGAHPRIRLGLAAHDYLADERDNLRDFERFVVTS